MLNYHEYFLINDFKFILFNDFEIFEAMDYLIYPDFKIYHLKIQDFSLY